MSEVQKITEFYEKITEAAASLAAAVDVLIDVHELAPEWMQSGAPDWITDSRVTGERAAQQPVEQPTAAQPTAAQQPAEQPTLEDVRAVLAKLAQNNKGDQVRDLLTKFGAAKLSDVAPHHLADLLTQAKDIQ